jgi:hypothetical protein
VTAQKKVEKGVRINIGAAKEKKEAVGETGSTSGSRTAEIIYDRSENPYLYDVSGPRKQKNYAQVDNEDMTDE